MADIDIGAEVQERSSVDWLKFKRDVLDKFASRLPISEETIQLIFRRGFFGGMRAGRELCRKLMGLSQCE